MGHRVRLLAGSLPALRPFLAASPTSRAYVLGSVDILALPLTEHIHDELHAAYGTGDWLEDGALLTTTDLAFAANASRFAPIGYLETDFFGSEGEQQAILWRDGGVALGPLRLSARAMTSRAPALWPINMVLKGLGLVSRPNEDEFTTFGLGHWRHTEEIVTLARELDAR